MLQNRQYNQSLKLTCEKSASFHSLLAVPGKNPGKAQGEEEGKYDFSEVD